MLDPQAGTCPQCQQSNPPEAVSCARCGAPLAASSAFAPDSPGAPTGTSTPLETVAPASDPAASGGLGASHPGDAESVPQGAPGGVAPGMLPHGPAGQSYGAGPNDPGFLPPGAQPSPPAYYGQMSGTGVPPGMGQNPGFQHPGVPQQPWYPQGAHPVPKYNRVTLGVVAILVGWLGIHKFMLGQTTAGIIMLLISLFTCGMVSSVIGLVEGILYLTKSDAEFYQTYEVERKAWF